MTQKTSFLTVLGPFAALFRAFGGQNGWKKGQKWPKMVQKCPKIPYFTFSEPKKNRCFPRFFDVLDRFLGRPRPKMARNRPSSGLRGALGRPGFGENFQKVVGMTPKTPKSVYKSVRDFAGRHWKAKTSNPPKSPFSAFFHIRSGARNLSEVNAWPGLRPGAGPKKMNCPEMVKKNQKIVKC